MSDTSGLMTTTVLNRKNSEVKNKHSCSWHDKFKVLGTLNRQAKIFSRKVPDISCLVTTIVKNTKISEVENKIPSLVV